MLFLTGAHRIIAYEELFFGAVNATSVHPCEGVKRTLHHNAAAVILGYNPPSGDTHPSAADVAITRQLKTALQLFEVKVLDHLIVGDGYRSLAERGSMGLIRTARRADPFERSGARPTPRAAPRGRRTPSGCGKPTRQRRATII